MMREWTGPRPAWGRSPGGGATMTKALDEIRRVFTEGTLAGLSDGQLLERFAARGDGEAFAAIVARHGAMVLSVCRSSLGPRDAADAEDAFQATFLVLVRRAGSFPVHGSLAGWLYRVARRVARQARVEASRRRARERAAAGRREAGRPHDPARDETPPPGPPGAGPPARAVSDADPALRPPRPDAATRRPRPSAARPARSRGGWPGPGSGSANGSPAAGWTPRRPGPRRWRCRPRTSRGSSGARPTRRSWPPAGRWSPRRPPRCWRRGPRAASSRRGSRRPWAPDRPGGGGRGDGRPRPPDRPRPPRRPAAGPRRPRPRRPRRPRPSRGRRSTPTTPPPPTSSPARSSTPTASRSTA